MRARTHPRHRSTLTRTLAAGLIFLIAMFALAGCGESGASTSPIKLSGTPKTTSAEVNVTNAHLTVKNGVGSLNLALNNPTSKTLQLVAVTSPSANTAMFMSRGGQMSSQPMTIPPHATLKLNGATAGSGNDYVMLTGVPTSLKVGGSTRVTLTFEVNSTTTSQVTFPVHVS